MLSWDGKRDRPTAQVWMISYDILLKPGYKRVDFEWNGRWRNLISVHCTLKIFKEHQQMLLRRIYLVYELDLMKRIPGVFGYSPASAMTSLSNISDFFFIIVLSQGWLIVHSLPLRFVLFILYLQYSRAHFFLDCGMGEGKKGVTWPPLQGVLLSLALCLMCWSAEAPALFWPLPAQLQNVKSPSPEHSPCATCVTWAYLLGGSYKIWCLWILNALGVACLKNNCSIAVSSVLLMIKVLINVIAS